MAAKEDDLTAVKRGAAILATCIAQTLNESDPTFQTRLLKKLDAAGGGLHELEMIAWMRTLLTGWSLTEGQKRPYPDMD